MSIFKNVFGSSDASAGKSGFNWNMLTSISQLEEISAMSNEAPVIIFKHSTRCSISRMVLKQFENQFHPDSKVTAYFLDLLNYRDLSNTISERFNVMHQSPQLLLITDGTCVYDVSHDAIDAENLTARLNPR